MHQPNWTTYKIGSENEIHRLCVDDKYKAIIDRYRYFGYQLPDNYFDDAQLKLLGSVICRTIIFQLTCDRCDKEEHSVKYYNNKFVNIKLCGDCDFASESLCSGYIEETDLNVKINDTIKQLHKISTDFLTNIDFNHIISSKLYAISIDKHHYHRIN